MKVFRLIIDAQGRPRAGLVANEAPFYATSVLIQTSACSWENSPAPTAPCSQILLRASRGCAFHGIWAQRLRGMCHLGNFLSAQASLACAGDTGYLVQPERPAWYWAWAE